MFVDVKRFFLSGLMAVTNQVEEGPVNARVVRKFGMKCGSHDSSLPDGDGIAALGGHYFDLRSNALNFRRANKNHLQRRISQFAVANGTVDLAAIGVASDADVESAQPRLLRILHFVG